MSQSYTTRTAKGSALTHAELDANFTALGISSNVRFGSLGVGTTENSANAGSITCTSFVTAYASDQRLKLNFTPIADAVKKVMCLGGYEFDWDVAKCDTLGFSYANEHETGLKAQEVQKVLPDAVRPAPFDLDEEGGSISGENYLTVDYAKLVPLLVQAIKEQQVQIAALEAKINKLVE